MNRNIVKINLAILTGLVILAGLFIAVPSIAIVVHGTYQAPSGGGGGEEPPPPTPTAPVISNIFTDVSYNSAVVHWTTNSSADSAVAYGLTTGYTATTTISESVTTHAVTLTGLSPLTTYHFRIATNNGVGTTYSADGTFITTAAPDVTPPAISALTVSNITPNSATVTFTTNEPATSTLTYSSVYGNVTLQNTTLTTNHSFDLSGLIPNTDYSVSVVATDASNNTAAPSTTSFKTLKDIVPPANVTNFTATAGDSQIVLTWENPNAPDFVGVIIRRSVSGYPASPTEGTSVYQGNGETTTDTGLTNGVTYYYTAFSYDTSDNFSSGAVTQGTPQGITPPPPGVCTEGALRCTGTTQEICHNDAWETYQINSAACGYVPPITPQPPEEEPIFIPPGGTEVTPEHKLSLADFEFWTAERTLRLNVTGGQVNILPAKILTVFLDPRFLTLPPKTLGLSIGDSNYLFGMDPITQRYAVDLTVPSLPQTLTGVVTVVYEDNRYDQIDFSLKIHGFGQVASSEKNNPPISEATVTLFQLVNGNWQLWNAALYNQKNPAFTSSLGAYGFMIPNGTYYLAASHPDFLTYETNRFTVENNIANESMTLIAVPLPLKDIIKEDAPLTENIKNVTVNLAEKVVFGTEVAQKAITDFIQNPQVEDINSNIAAPVLVGIAVANTAAAVSIFSLWNFIQFLLTQPLLLLDRRRRKGWGIVYNALTKMPIDLAIVRLLDAKTGRVIQTRVTDKHGRFVFFAAIGEYVIEVTKRGFTFPSAFLKTKHEDEVFTNLYHGEIIKVTASGGAITPNIPLDPEERRVSKTRLVLKQLLHGLQYGLSLGGLAMILISLVISPGLLIAGFAVIHVLLFLLFLRLAKTPAPKSWGIVYDEKSKQPLRFVIARIFETQYNKLLSTQITDAKGRYSFLVGKNIYFVTFEKPGYESAKTGAIDLRKKKEGEVIAIDIPLKTAATGPTEIEFGGTKMNK